MNVLLVYPRFPVTYWGFEYTLRLIGKRAPLPPLGLITVAALLPSHWHPRLEDSNVRDLGDEQLQWADLVLNGGLLIQVNSIQETLTRAHAFEVAVTVGGPAPTTSPEIFEEQREFLGRQPVPLAMAGILTALPGTALSRRLEPEGRLRHRSNGDSFSRPNFVPTMNEEALLRGYGEFMGRALLRGRSKVRQAVVHAVQGEHLSRYTREHVVPRMEMALKVARAEVEASRITPQRRDTTPKLFAFSPPDKTSLPAHKSIAPATRRPAVRQHPGLARGMS